MLNKKYIEMVAGDTDAHMFVKDYEYREAMYSHYENGKLISTVIIRKRYLFFDTITWFTKEGFRKKCLAIKLIKLAKKEYLLTFAKVRLI